MKVPNKSIKNCLIQHMNETVVMLVHPIMYDISLCIMLSISVTLKETKGKRGREGEERRREIATVNSHTLEK